MSKNQIPSDRENDDYDLREKGNTERILKLTKDNEDSQIQIDLIRRESEEKCSHLLETIRSIEYREAKKREEIHTELTKYRFFLLMSAGLFLVLVLSFGTMLFSNVSELMKSSDSMDEIIKDLQKTYARADMSISAEFVKLKQMRTQEIEKLNTLIEKELAAIQSNRVPTGTIVAFIGKPSELSSDWLLCDGNSIPIDKYPDLYAIVGERYGTTSTKLFKLPDYRGYFLRGAIDAETYHRDPDHKNRVDRFGKKIGPLVGSYQTDGLKKHSHSLRSEPWRLLTTKKMDKPIQLALSSGKKTISFYPLKPEDVVTNPHNHRDSETRPKNIYVYWVIKASK